MFCVSTFGTTTDYFQNLDLILWLWSLRRFWHRHQRLGRWRRPPLQEVPPQQPAGGPSPVAWLVPPVAREALRRRAAPGPVPHVHAVQGHERGLARPAGNALLQAEDRGAPPQAERKAEPQENMNNFLGCRDCEECEWLKQSRWSRAFMDSWERCFSAWCQAVFHTWTVHMKLQLKHIYLGLKMETKIYISFFS